MSCRRRPLATRSETDRIWSVTGQEMRRHGGETKTAAASFRGVPGSGPMTPNARINGLPRTHSRTHAGNHFRPFSLRPDRYRDKLTVRSNMVNRVDEYTQSVLVRVTVIVFRRASNTWPIALPIDTTFKNTDVVFISHRHGSPGPYAQVVQKILF